MLSEIVGAVLTVFCAMIGLVLLYAVLNWVACVMARVMVANKHINQAALPNWQRFPRRPLPYTNGSERGDWPRQGLE